MALDPAAVQAVATGIFGALAAIFGYKATSSHREARGAVEGLNGHVEAVARLRTRLNAQNKRIARLQADQRTAAVEREELRHHVKALESRGA